MLMGLCVESFEKIWTFEMVTEESRISPIKSMSVRMITNPTGLEGNDDKLNDKVPLIESTVKNSNGVPKGTPDWSIRKTPNSSSASGALWKLKSNFNDTPFPGIICAGSKAGLCSRNTKGEKGYWCKIAELPLGLILTEGLEIKSFKSIRMDPEIGRVNNLVA